MKNNLYDDNGYLNMRLILSRPAVFNFIVGGRGTGKTYGAIKIPYDDKKKFIYMRRTDSILQIILNSEFNPIKPVLRDEGKDFASEKINKYVTGFYHARPDDDGMIRASGTPFGVGVGLSIMGNLRGWSATDYDVLINDEFIPDANERPLKNEATTFFNAYETLNRNRELQGLPPVKVLCLANSNDLTNDYFLTLNLIGRAQSMKEHGEEYWYDPSRSLAIYMLEHSPISEKKKDTVLYKLTAGTAFAGMALGNEFSYNDHGTVGSRPLREYSAVVKVGELVIYKHKSDGTFYSCLHLTGTCPEYGITDIELQRFTSAYIYLWSAYLQDDIIFENYTCEALFRKYFK